MAAILDVLHAKHAGLLCGAVTGHPSLARRTVAEGHTVGSHGFDHSNVASLSADEIRARVRSDVRAWREAARVTPIPHPTAVRAVRYRGERARSGGVPVTGLWDVDPRDWSSPGATAVTRRVMSDVHQGSIVVLHAIDGTACALGPTDRLRVGTSSP